MSEKTLVLIEATGIQEYIFGSNQLAQNIGASELVTQATVDWVVERLNELGLSHNAVRNRLHGDYEPDHRSILSDHLQAEIIYMGGGNAMLLFQMADQAMLFSRSLTAFALKHAPGLSLVVARSTYNSQETTLVQQHHDLRMTLAKRKLNRSQSSPLLGLGVTAACVYTGLPAIGRSDEPAIVGDAYVEKMNETGEQAVLISATVAAKLRAEQAGKDRLKRHLPQVGDTGFDFIYDFDEFGEKGESSYLAVIHADGNNMGDRIRRIGEEFDQLGDDVGERYANALRAFSQSVKEAAEKALQSAVALLLDWSNIPSDEKGVHRYGGVVRLKRTRGKYLLPFRPIVFGGDDVTFVAEGRLGLALAAKYLEVYSAQPLRDRKPAPAYARSGVAIVKSHYPFSRAYDLANELINSAKGYILDQDENGQVTAIDWHFAVGGLVLPLKQVREREYIADDGGSSLLMRPLRLQSADNEWRTWEVFTNLLGQFIDKEKGWAERRNKIKAFRDALRGGPDTVIQFLSNYQLELPAMTQMPADMQRQGWQGSYCGYFDAVEALDFYVPLKGG